MVEDKGYGRFVERCENALSPELKANNTVLQRQIDKTRAGIESANSGAAELTYSGDVPGVDFRNVVVKPLMPDFLYRPLYGRPRYINIPEIRRLSDTPTAGLCIKTIVDQVANIPWQIRMRDPEQSPNDLAIDEVTERLENPNRNKDDFSVVLKKLTRDILTVDAGVLVKVFDLASYDGANINERLLPEGRRSMLEFYAFDGGTFTINPNLHGLLPDQRAYFQYNYHKQSMPTPFGREEIIYMMANPRTSNIYGVSPMEMAYDVVRYMVFGVTAGIDHFTRNEIPKGILSIIDANSDHIKEFASRLEDRVSLQDSATEEKRWVSAKVPVTNQEVKFTPLQIPPETVRLLETQQWYIKLIFACFGLTPSEAGFTEDSNRATEIVQSEVFRRKAILPMLNTLEDYINRELLPEFGYDDLVFEFVRKDIQSELREQKLWNDYLKNGQMTVNEWRNEHGDLDPVDWGDEPFKGGGFGGESLFGNSMFEGSAKESEEGVGGD